MDSLLNNLGGAATTGPPFGMPSCFLTVVSVSEILLQHKIASPYEMFAVKWSKITHIKTSINVDSVN